MPVQITMLEDVPAGSGGGTWRKGDTKTAADDYAASLIGAGRACAADGSLKDGLVSAGDQIAVPSPAAPLIIANDASVSVHFTPSANATVYTATLSTGASASGTASPLTVPAANGTAVTCTLTASNGASSATSAASNSVTPTARPAAISAIPNLMAWWDASQLAAVADGTAVASWPDASGNGRTATGFGSPAYRTAANWGGGGTGRPAVGFNGVSATAQRFHTPISGAMTGHEITLFVVFDKASTNNQATQPDQRLFSQEVTKLDRGFTLQLSNGNYSGGADIVTIRGGTNQVDVSGGISLSTPYLVSVVTGAQMFLNGTRQAPNSFSITGPLSRATPFTLGHMYGGNGGVGNNAAVGLQGRIAEVLLFRGRLNDAQRQAVEGYLATKYGLTVAAQATL